MDSLGLVIMGGTARGLGSIGFIRFIQEENIKIDIIAGSSSGSFVASLYALGYKWDQMVSILEKIEVFKYFKIQNLLKYRSLLTRETFRKELSKIVDEDVNIENLPIKLIIYSTNIDCKQRFCFSSGNLIDAVITSCSYPLLLPEYRSNLGKLRDGDLYEDFSCDELRSLGANKVIGVKYKQPQSLKDKKDIVSTSVSILRNLNRSTCVINNQNTLDYEFNFTSDIGYLNFKDIRKVVNSTYLEAQKQRKEILSALNK